jgi:hypothetical protein
MSFKFSLVIIFLINIKPLIDYHLEHAFDAIFKSSLIKIIFLKN